MRIPGGVGAALVCVGCAGPSQPPAAANWLEVGAATNGVKLFVDVESLTGGDGWVQLNQRFVFPERGPEGLSRVEQQVIYVCGSRTVRTLSSVEFTRSGGEVRIQKENAKTDYKIPPGTLPEYVFDLVC